MRDRNVRLLGIVLGVLGCVALLLSTTSRAPLAPRGVEAGEFVIGEPISHGRLTVFPVLSRVVRDEDPFLTLDEGLRNGTVEIMEVGAAAESPDAGDSNASTGIASDFPMGRNRFGSSARVNRLLVRNTSARPLYLMPGEVIVGGQQDRTIAEETIITSTGEPVPIDAFCVESGRWSARSVEETADYLRRLTSQSIAEHQAEKLARQAKRGKFVASGISLSHSTRYAVQANRGQDDVWENVSAANRSAGLAVPTDAFTANYVDDAVRSRLDGYLEALSSRVADRERIVGVIVAVDGELRSSDVFATTPLFRKLWPKLLKGHALDAVHAELAEAASPESGPEWELVAGARSPFGSERDEDSTEWEVVGRGQIDGFETTMSFSVDQRQTASAPGGLGGLDGVIGHPSDRERSAEDPAARSRARSRTATLANARRFLMASVDGGEATERGQGLVVHERTADDVYGFQASEPAALGGGLGGGFIHAGGFAP